MNCRVIFLFVVYFVVDENLLIAAAQKQQLNLIYKKHKEQQQQLHQKHQQEQMKLHQQQQEEQDLLQKNQQVELNTFQQQQLQIQQQILEQQQQLITQQQQELQQQQHPIEEGSDVGSESGQGTGAFCKVAGINYIGYAASCFDTCKTVQVNFATCPGGKVCCSTVDAVIKYVFGLIS